MDLFDFFLNYYSVGLPPRARRVHPPRSTSVKFHSDGTSPKTRSELFHVDVENGGKSSWHSTRNVGGCRRRVWIRFEEEPAAFRAEYEKRINRIKVGKRRTRKMQLFILTFEEIGRIKKRLALKSNFVRTVNRKFSIAEDLLRHREREKKSRKCVII